MPVLQACIYFARMEWTPENIRLLRTHLKETQEQFATRVGLTRRQTVHDWETGKKNPSGPVRKLLDFIANDSGFTERVAARLKKQIERERGDDCE